MIKKKRRLLPIHFDKREKNKGKKKEFKSKQKAKGKIIESIKCLVKD